MEAIKDTITAKLILVYGSGCRVFLDTSNNDTYLKICIHDYPQHVIYVSPDTFGRHYICHYVHVEDLKMLLEFDPEDMKKWDDYNLWKHFKLSQSIAQLQMRVAGRHHEFLKCTMFYVRIALDRIGSYGGRRCDTPGQLTFAEALAMEKEFPEPKLTTNTPAIAHKKKNAH